MSGVRITLRRRSLREIEDMQKRNSLARWSHPSLPDRESSSEPGVDTINNFPDGTAIVSTATASNRQILNRDRTSRDLCDTERIGAQKIESLEILRDSADTIPTFPGKSIIVSASEMSSGPSSVHVIADELGRNGVSLPVG